MATKKTALAPIRDEPSRTIAADGSSRKVLRALLAFSVERPQHSAESLAEQIGVPLLGSIPLDPAVAAGGDAGEPAAIATPHAPAAQAFAALAERIVTEAIPLVERATCTARLFFKTAGLLRTTP